MSGALGINVRHTLLISKSDPLQIEYMKIDSQMDERDESTASDAIDA